MARHKPRKQNDTRGLQSPPTDRGPLVEGHAVVAAVCLAFTGLAIVSPGLFERLMQEDGYVEWGTAMAYLAGAVLASIGALRATGSNGRGVETRSRDRNWPAATIYAGIAVFCVFVAGEELSWGQRLFGFTPPEAFLAGNYQQELEIHNLILGSLLTYHGPTLTALGYGVFLPLLAWWSRRVPATSGFRALVARWAGFAEPTRSLVPWFVLVAVLYEWYPVRLGGEAIELLLGVLFAMDMTLRLHADGHPASRWFPPLPVSVAAIVVAFSVATPMVADAVHEANAGPLVARAQEELDRLGNDLASPGVVQRALIESAGIHQRVYTSTHLRLLRFGPTSAFLERRSTPAEDDSTAARRDRVGYFLDPWDSAYWLYYSPSARILLVYSVGPNRKRDTPVTDLSPERLRDADLDGDDLGIAIEVVPDR